MRTGAKIVGAAVLVCFFSALAAAVLLKCGYAWTDIILTALTGLAGVIIFITTRHIQITQARQRIKWPKLPHKTAEKGPGELCQEYFLFVLGSGGHTKEMLMMMDDGPRDLALTHRRYLISSGDGMSENHLEDYEAEQRSLSSTPGTYDKCIVARARRVHQPLWTTPWTALLSLVDIFPALMSPPRLGAAEVLEYPGVIFSNGPATGFFVALAVHILKVLSLVPESRMKFVYIESWARIATLSLTGKLLYYTGLADAFYVQHPEVAAKYGVANAGEMVFNARLASADS